MFRYLYNHKLKLILGGWVLLWGLNYFLRFRSVSEDEVILSLLKSEFESGDRSNFCYKKVIEDYGSVMLYNPLFNNTLENKKRKDLLLQCRYKYNLLNPLYQATK